MAEHSSDPDAPTTHEPVLDEARIAGRVVAATTGAFAIAAAAGVHWTTDASTLTAAEVAVVGGACAVVNYLVPRWRAWRARRYVTPLADPRSADGHQLIALPVARTLAATDAANAPLEPEQPTTPTPWNEDDNVVAVAS